jgi:hypothetical protein
LDVEIGKNRVKMKKHVQGFKLGKTFMWMLMKFWIVDLVHLLGCPIV